MTSAHVVGGEGARRGRAALVDGRELTFEVVGADPLSDLAVLWADADDLSPAELGDSERLRVGLGLAVPMSAATRAIIGSLMRDGHVRRAYIGLAGGPRPLPPRAREGLDQPTCVEVVEVVPGSPAERAGLRPEDLIVRLDGHTVNTAHDLQELMVAERIGARTPLFVLRDGRALTLELVPAELPT